MRSGRWAFALTLIAVLWCAALVPAAFAIPVYEDGSTLAEENGAWVALPVALPVAFALLAWLGLHLRCARASRLGARLAWVAIALIAAYGTVGAASIGTFVVPAAVLLAVAATLTPFDPTDPPNQRVEIGSDFR
jgi:uncharacterized membrane protein YhaH (DUF805 family)